MTSENELTVETREQLTKVRTVLLRLHKTLLDFERHGYERDRGKIDNATRFATGHERSRLLKVALGAHRGDG